MERRAFLRSAGWGLAATGLSLGTPWPAFLTRAFGDESEAAGKRDRTVELAGAIARARAEGRPLLLIVVPADPAHRWERGQELGELINHGGPGVTDDLLLCELACATRDEAAQVMKLRIDGDPAMLVIELDGEGGEHLPSTAVELQPRPALRPDNPEDEAASRARIAEVGQRLHTAVLPRADSLARRAERTRAALGDELRTALDDGLAARTPIAPTLARRAAAVLAVVASEGAGDARVRARTALDAAGATYIRGARPAGAVWATSSGCGMQIEGEPQVGYRCGQGSVPALSRRFLHFYGAAE